MQKYSYNNQIFLIIDGELYVRIEAFGLEKINEVVTEAEPKKRGRPKGPRNPRGPKPGGHLSRGKLLEQEDLKQIKEMINAGYKAFEIAQKFEATAQYIYNIKMKMKKDGELTLVEEPNV